MAQTFIMTKAMPLGDMVFIIVAFLLLMVILKKVAYGPLTKVLDQRADKINKDLDDASKKSADANTLVEQRQKELSESKTQASQMIATAKKSAKEQSDALIQAANTQVAGMRQSAEDDAVQMKEEAMTTAKKDVADLSVNIASKLIQKELSADDQRALIDAYLAELGQQ
ncbi:F0F1 ATP synthase subunit B [Fructobacillus sp. M1-13]|uniref:ATP synthase subunit b n=1 Tax=Fructobacillus papyriferae TaxID=2713171 RepID=A0ABS5QRP5_9LACO|nr:F0F1 ATP synthase subunit B [Fructobacillus papyriferae]MBS9335165.1 F0F1 ATP synthase subunit B [Fructobacillus papyriferae]MCD2159166.1 F0F1 ATP synthase subunit B [Fructobacillus papyriferae]